MAQNENYSQVDLRVGTEEQFNAKVGTLPAGTLFGVTDSTVSKADLSTDLKNEINGKINKPANPTSDSAVVINSSGAVSTKLLTSITGKAEVAVSSTTPLNDEILWINPDGTSGGGEKIYRHNIYFFIGPPDGFYLTIYSSNQIEFTPSTLGTYLVENGMSSAIGTLVKGRVNYPIFQINASQFFQINASQSETVIYVLGISSTDYPSTEFNTGSLQGNDTVTEI